MSLKQPWKSDNVFLFFIYTFLQIGTCALLMVVINQIMHDFVVQGIYKA